MHGGCSAKSGSPLDLGVNESRRCAADKKIRRAGKFAEVAQFASDPPPPSREAAGCLTASGSSRRATCGSLPHSSEAVAQNRSTARGRRDDLIQAVLTAFNERPRQISRRETGPAGERGTCATAS